MKQTLSIPSVARMRGTLAAVTLTAACSAAWALPQFTITPTGAGLVGTPVTADNFVVSDYSTTTFTSPTSFLEKGFLSVQNLQLGGSLITAPGLNTTYGLYVEFTSTGTLNSATLPNTGTFDTLTYTLYGYNGGPATFGVGAGGSTTISLPNNAAPVALATGTLIDGDVSTSPRGVPSANATVTFTPVASTFFTSPTPFYTTLETSFTNTRQSVTPLFTGNVQTGFRITQGGGTMNFVSAVPEPETYAMLLAGLAAVGFVANRRKR